MNLEIECRITRSCIYWADDKRENTDLIIKGDSFEEVKKKLRQTALRLDVSSIKLVQDIFMKIDGEWVAVSFS